MINFNSSTTQTSALGYDPPRKTIPDENRYRLTYGQLMIDAWPRLVQHFDVTEITQSNTAQMFENVHFNKFTFHPDDCGKHDVRVYIKNPYDGGRLLTYSDGTKIVGVVKTSNFVPAVDGVLNFRVFGLKSGKHDENIDLMDELLELTGARIPASLSNKRKQIQYSFLQFTQLLISN